MTQVEGLGAGSLPDLSGLFEPITIGRLTLPNRIIMGPMGYQNAIGGVHHPGMANYYGRRAAGGAGLIIAGGAAVPHETSHLDEKGAHFHGIGALAAWKHIAAAVKASGGRIAPELAHAGYAREDGAMPNPYLKSASPSGIFMPLMLDPSAPSPAPVKLGEPSTPEEIEAIIQAFGEAAEVAMSMGFDAIEVHGGHGFLIDQFLWAETNHRTDEYGGDIKRRSRFAADVVRECRRRTSPDFPIFFRFSQWKVSNYRARLASTPSELADVLEPIADAGVDVFDASTRRFWDAEFEDSDLNLAGWAKKITGKPSVAVGSVGIEGDKGPEELFLEGETENAGARKVGVSAEGLKRLNLLMERFHRGDFDFVAVARIIVANSNWPILMRDSRFHEVAEFRADRILQIIEAEGMLESAVA